MALPPIEYQIWLALKSRIDTLATNPTMTKYEPGQVANPSGAPFILLSDIRNDHQRWSINRQSNGRVAHARSGTLILSVQWPLATAIGHGQLVDIGGDIAAHFPADTLMRWNSTCLRVTRDADVQQPYVDGVYRVIVVRVLWSTV